MLTNLDDSAVVRFCCFSVLCRMYKGLRNFFSHFYHIESKKSIVLLIRPFFVVVISFYNRPLKNSYFLMLFDTAINAYILSANERCLYVGTSINTSRNYVEKYFKIELTVRDDKTKKKKRKGESRSLY